MNNETPKAESQNLCCEYIPTRRERFVAWLFPATQYAVPHVELGGAKDFAVITTNIEMSWKDRLRVLISGRITVRTHTSTENRIGTHVTVGAFGARPPRWMERKPKK